MPRKGTSNTLILLCCGTYRILAESSGEKLTQPCEVGLEGSNSFLEELNEVVEAIIPPTCFNRPSSSRHEKVGEPQDEINREQLGPLKPVGPAVTGDLPGDQR